MLKRLLNTLDVFFCGFVTANAVRIVVQHATYIRKGQQQMMADYLMLELVEQGRL